jgi:hypothetical protein
MTQKQYLSAQQLLEDSFRLGANIIEDGFRPTKMIAIWRGGVPMGIAIQELLSWYGIETDHIAIRTQELSPRRSPVNRRRCFRYRPDDRSGYRTPRQNGQVEYAR